MSLDRFEFEILSYLEREGEGSFPIRQLSDTLCISGKAVEKGINSLKSTGLISENRGRLSVSGKGLDALEPYRVKRAIILAAGIGNRMMPATVDRPKPMVRINGIRIIDTLLDALVNAGIKEITIIGGYRFEKLNELKIKYPFIRLIENNEYASTNNISSALLSFDTLHDGCYFCEADLFISNPQIITKYQYSSNILGSYSMETDDWSFRMEDGFVTDYKKGNSYCYNYYGISYWTADDCEKLKRDFLDVYNNQKDGSSYFWEFVPFILRKENYHVEIRPCRKQDITEIDNYYELAQLDSSYREE